jgi:hypothetical protein
MASLRRSHTDGRHPPMALSTETQPTTSCREGRTAGFGHSGAGFRDYQLPRSSTFPYVRGRAQDRIFVSTLLRGRRANLRKPPSRGNAPSRAAPIDQVANGLGPVPALGPHYCRRLFQPRVDVKGREPIGNPRCRYLRWPRRAERGICINLG